MVTDRQVRMLMKLINEEETLAAAAAKAGMDEKTARRWRDYGMVPSESRVEPHGGPGRTPLRMSGKRFGRDLRSIQDLRRRLFLKICNGAIRNGFRMDRFAACSAGLRHGVALRGRKRRCSSLRFMIPESCASPTLRGWESLRSPSRDSFSIIWSIILYCRIPSGRLG